jgi:hypothetical protein
VGDSVADSEVEVGQRTVLPRFEQIASAGGLHQRIDPHQRSPAIGSCLPIAARSRLALRPEFVKRRDDLARAGQVLGTRQPLLFVPEIPAAAVVRHSGATGRNDERNQTERECVAPLACQDVHQDDYGVV